VSHPLPPLVRRARRALLVLPLSLPLAAAPLAAQPVQKEPAVAATAGARGEAPDPALVARIEDEGFNRSQVMDVMSWLTDVHGPRLTGSPALRGAADWAMKTMTGWGLSNVKLEPWGPFGRGWSSERFSLQALTPQAWPVLAYPSAWTPGTSGPVSGEAVLVQIDSAPDLARYRGRLRGKFVLVGAPRDVAARFAPQASRRSDADLETLAQAPMPQPGGGRPGGNRAGAPNAGGPNADAFRAAAALRDARAKLFVDEGVAAVLLQGQGDDGTVFVSSTGGSRDTAAGPMVPTVVLAAEHYGRIARTLAKGVPVTLELNAQNRWYDADRNAFNVVAEIPGTDKALKDEVVMVGAHFDSWHAGTGATDNAAGSAVMMEALRILKAARVPLKRTVRIGLWTGEEQGLLGSRAYVKDHFLDLKTGATKPEFDKFSVYFNVDNGTGKIRGVYMQGNEQARPVFDAWMTPFKPLGMRTLTLANTGGTDHLSFDALGLPGFQFIQDEVEYGTRTHHSNMDLFERIQPDDMKWNAVVVATFVMQAANREQRFPRKPAAAPARTTSQP
jgi:hypothetical protein